MDDDVIPVALFLLFIVLVIGAIVWITMDDEKEDQRKRAHCVEMGGMVAPAETGWACAFPNGIKAER